MDVRIYETYDETFDKNNKYSPHPTRICHTVFVTFWMSMKHEESISFLNYTTISTEASTWSMLQDTLIIVIGSTLLSVIVGVGMAWIMAYTDIRLKKFLQIFIILPFIIPSYIVTIAWTQLTTSLPFVDINLYSHLGIIFVLGISHYPLVYLFTAMCSSEFQRNWNGRFVLQEVDVRQQPKK